MQHVWSPWRFQYVSKAAMETDCIFCEALKERDLNNSLIVHRGVLNFILLNRYPYNNGHMMIAPYLHVANPADAPAEVVEDMMRLSQVAIRALRESYHPDGFNIGMNLGRSAGAGVEDHYHLHIVPRWNGDTNFMTALAETRVLPEAFSVTLEKLKPHF
jgi:ATP adenylyltransferase